MTTKYKYYVEAQDIYGNAIPQTSVTVKLAGTGTLATLYLDDNVTTIANPMLTDVNGWAGFKAVSGEYDIFLTKGTGPTAFNRAQHSVFVGIPDNGAVTGSVGTNQVAVGTGTNVVAGSNALTFDGERFTTSSGGGCVIQDVVVGPVTMFGNAANEASSDSLVSVGLCVPHGSIDGDLVFASKRTGMVDPHDWREIARMKNDTGDFYIAGTMQGKNFVSGTGSPEGVFPGIIGTIFQRTDGSSGTFLYVKTTSTGNVGWVAFGP